MGDFVALVVQLLVLVFPFVVLLVLGRRLFALLAPYRMYIRGDFAAAGARFEKLSAGWLVGRYSRTQLRYNVALCHFMRGELEASVAGWQALANEKLDATLRRNLIGALVANLVLLGRDASAYLPELDADISAGRSLRAPTYLAMAHAKLSSGDAASARALLVRSEMPGVGTEVGRTIFFKVEKWQADAIGLLRGWLHLRFGDLPAAAHDLAGAANGPAPNVYQARARELLATVAASSTASNLPVDEAPASLAAHVLG